MLCSVVSSHAVSSTIKMFTLPYLSVFPNNLLCHTKLLYTCTLHTHTFTVNSVVQFSCQCQNVMLYFLSLLSNDYNKASPGSLQTSSEAALSSCSQKNLKALHSWCLPFLPSPTLQHEMFVLFLHVEVSCKDNLDYSHLVLRINLDSFNAGSAALLSQSPNHKSLETFTPPTYFPTAP